MMVKLVKCVSFNLPVWAKWEKVNVLYYFDATCTLTRTGHVFIPPSTVACFLLHSQMIKSVMCHNVCLHLFWSLFVFAIFLIAEGENVFIRGLFIHIWRLVIINCYCCCCTTLHLSLRAVFVVFHIATIIYLKK